MKKFCYVICLGAFLMVAGIDVSYAQEKASGYNPNSVYPVHNAYIMFKKTLWRRMDLEEKQNSPFFSRNGELPTILIDAVKAGILFPYTNDSVVTRMSKETFLENLKLPEEGGGLTDEEREMGFGGDEGGDFGDWGDGDGDGDTVASDEGVLESDEFPSRDFSIVELKEDMFFDRRRSRMYYDIQALTLFLPADKNPALYEKPLASFKYKDLVQLFVSMPDEAIWYNAQNIAEHRNLADAFNLRLFSSNLTKFANPDDRRITEIYDKSRREGILASQRLEHDMIEFENELWEF